MVAPPNKWHQYGFTRSPYSTEAIKVSEDGAKLLVGRDNELDTILSDLNSGAQVIALEGDYGVGKTRVSRQSQLMKRRRGGPTEDRCSCRSRPKSPCGSAQRKHRNPLRKKVYMRIAGTLLLASASLKAEGRHLEGLERLRRWLRRPKEEAGQRE